MSVKDKAPEKSERGRRPWIDPDGTVHGSGSGAGGGSPGEDYDADPVGGGGHTPYQGTKPIEDADKPKDKFSGQSS